MSKNDLLEVEDAPLMVDLLTNLDHGVPGVGCPRLLAVVALDGLNDELDYEGALKYGVGLDLFLDGDLQLDALAVRLGPHEASVDQLHPVQALYFLQTQGQQFLRLQTTL